MTTATVSKVAGKPGEFCKNRNQPTPSRCSHTPLPQPPCVPGVSPAGQDEWGGSSQWCQCRRMKSPPAAAASPSQSRVHLSQVTEHRQGAEGVGRRHHGGL